MVSKKCYKLAKCVQKVISERKFINEAYTATFNDATTLLPTNPCRLIVQGDGHQQRIGDVIEISSFNITYTMYLPGNATTGWTNAELDYSMTCRILVVQWHKAYVHSSSPDLSDILDFGTQSTISAANRVYAPYKRNTEDFTVLYDKFHIPHWIWHQVDASHWQPTMQSGDGVFQITVMPPHSVKYNPTNNDGDDHVMIFLISDSAATPHPAIRMYVRINYYDA